MTTIPIEENADTRESRQKNAAKEDVVGTTGLLAKSGAFFRKSKTIISQRKRIQSLAKVRKRICSTTKTLMVAFIPHPPWVEGTVRSEHPGFTANLMKIRLEEIGRSFLTSREGRPADPLSTW